MTFSEKQGCKPDEVPSMASFIKTECPHLEFVGVMTIGSFDHDLKNGPNKDFLVFCKSFFLFRFLF